MTAVADDIRKRLHELADLLPADATWDDVWDDGAYGMTPRAPGYEGFNYRSPARRGKLDIKRSRAGAAAIVRGGDAPPYL